MIFVYLIQPYNIRILTKTKNYGSMTCLRKDIQNIVNVQTLGNIYLQNHTHMHAYNVQVGFYLIRKFSLRSLISLLSTQCVESCLNLVSYVFLGQLDQKRQTCLNMQTNFMQPKYLVYIDIQYFVIL